MSGSHSLSLNTGSLKISPPQCPWRHVQGGPADEKAPLRKVVAVTLASADEAGEADEVESVGKDKAVADENAVLTALRITEGLVADNEADGVLLSSCCHASSLAPHDMGVPN